LAEEESAAQARSAPYLDELWQARAQICGTVDVLQGRDFAFALGAEAYLSEPHNVEEIHAVASNVREVLEGMRCGVNEMPTRHTANNFLLIERLSRRRI